MTTEPTAPAPLEIAPAYAALALRTLADRFDTAEPDTIGNPIGALTILVLTELRLSQLVLAEATSAVLDIWRCDLGHGGHGPTAMVRKLATLEGTRAQYDTLAVILRQAADLVDQRAAA